MLKEVNVTACLLQGKKIVMTICYALRMGFSIQKGKPRYYSGSKNIKQREFVCSKEGFKVDEDPCEEKKLNKLETRTGCKAFVRLIVEDGI